MIGTKAMPLSQAHSTAIGQPFPVPIAEAPIVSRSRLGLGLKIFKRKQRKHLRTGERIFLWASRIVIWFCMVLVVTPFLWVAMTSIQPGVLYFGGFFPTGFTLSHYQDLWSSGYFDWVRNSVLICTTVGAATVGLVATMAYAFSRFRFKGRKYGLMTLLLIQMFPAQMSFVAYGYLLHQIGGFDTLWGYILCMIGGGLPFNAWLFKGYIDTLPRDLEEAAYVDGASKFTAFRRVILPLTRPMMAVIFIFVWFGLYSDFIIASYLLPSIGNFTVTLGINSLNSGAGSFAQNWTLFSAGATISCIPLMVVFLSMQRFLVSGLSRGAVKG